MQNKLKKNKMRYPLLVGGSKSLISGRGFLHSDITKDTKMLLSEFDYELPEGLIAQRPSDKRENSRMMVLNRDKHEILNKHFYDIVDLLDENHILILNDTKVIPARLYGYKDTGAKIEVFLLKKRENKVWEVLIKPSKRVRVGTEIKISDELSVHRSWERC